MKTYRVTTLDMYENCPHCFYLAHVMKIKRQKNENLTFGTLVHDTIEKYHKGEETKGLSFYLQVILSSYKKIYPKHKNYDFIEKRITRELVHPVTKESLGVKISGKIDKGRDGWIEDHKTSSRRYQQEEVDKHFQLKSYAYLNFMDTGKLPTGVRINVIVKNKVPYVQIVDSFVTKGDLIMWFERTKKIFEGIAKKEFEPSRAWWHYYDICPGNRRG